MEIMNIDKKPIPTTVVTPFGDIETESKITKHGLQLANRITIINASWEEKSDEDFTITTYVNLNSVHNVTINCSDDGIRVILFIKNTPYTFNLFLDQYGYNILKADKL